MTPEPQVSPRRTIPFVVAVNRFAGSPNGTEDQIRHALALPLQVPITFVDARLTDRYATC